jgi:hypothetical protein
MNGLEARRRCGWLTEGERGPRRVVWARRPVFLETCPRSYITAESTALVEAFTARKLVGGGDPAALPARTVDAFCVLENELRAETSNATE